MKQIILAGLLTALGLFAVETKTWRQAEYTDFEKGVLTRLSLRSDGQLTVAPRVKELLDASVAYLWACGQDSQGNVYVGGGSTSGTTAKLFVVDRAGKSKVAAELDGMEIHAIAIDSRDAVYAATAPDGKVYKIARPGAKAEVFFDPKAKYIWSLVFASNGDLFIGTGEKGEIWRVTPDGKGTMYFHTDESHARSMSLDAQGDLIVGTEPSGLVLRVTGQDKGFVLYQTAKREVTSLAIGRDGAVYAAAVGSRTGGHAIPPLAAPVSQPQGPAAAGQSASAGTAAQRGLTSVVPASSTPPAGRPPVAGGSEVDRIEKDGYGHKIWSDGTELVYTIAMDGQDRVLIGTGNKGNLYRTDDNQRSTMLTSLAPTQVTQMVTGKGGAMYAVTGNIGKLYEIGPGIEENGVFESEVMDAGSFTYWGRAEIDGHGSIAVESRSGNVNSPRKDWSEWAALKANRLSSPSARFVQYRLKMAGDAVVDGVNIAYQAKNVAPVIERVEATPANYKLPAPAALSASATPASMTLPPMGKKRASRNTAVAAVTPGELGALSYAKGFIGVRWSASDENGDALVYRVEIRGVKEKDWKLLRDPVRERYYGWDSTTFPDGEYVVRVTASDAAGNTPRETLSASLESDPFLIDNSAPEIQGLKAALNGAKVDVSWTAKDALSNIDHAEYSVNGGEWTVAEPVTRLSDSQELQYRIAIDKAAGEFTIAVRIFDEFDNQSAAKVVGRY